MNILFRYIAKDFLRNWLGVLVSLAMMIFVSSLLGDINAAFQSWAKFLEFLNRTASLMPELIEIMLPMTVLIAAVMTLTAFGRTSELVAMKAAGMGMVRLIFPLCAVLLLVSSFAYLNQNYLYRYLHHDAVEKARYSKDQWRALGNDIFYVASADLITRTLQGARIFRAEDYPFRLSQLDSLGTGWRSGSGSWDFSTAIVRERQSNHWAVKELPWISFKSVDFPDVFRDIETDAHHTPFLDLYQEIKQRETKGLEANLYRLNLYQKVAAVAAPFLMVLVGLPLSQFHFRTIRGASAIVITVLIGLVYMVGTQILYILGKGGVLSPLVATWSSNLAFALLGLALLRLAR